MDGFDLVVGKITVPLSLLAGDVASEDQFLHGLDGELRGLENSEPIELRNAMQPPRFTEDEYRQTARVNAADLDEPERLAEQLLRRFLEATGRRVG